MSWEVMKSGPERNQATIQIWILNHNSSDLKQEAAADEKIPAEISRAARETFVLIRPETLANKWALKTLDGFFLLLTLLPKTHSRQKRPHALSMLLINLQTFPSAKNASYEQSAEKKCSFIAWTLNRSHYRVKRNNYQLQAISPNKTCYSIKEKCCRATPDRHGNESPIISLIIPSCLKHERRNTAAFSQFKICRLFLLSESGWNWRIVRL